MDIYTKLQGSEARVKMKCVGDGEDTIKRVKVAPATIRKNNINVLHCKQSSN